MVYAGLMRLGFDRMPPIPLDIDVSVFEDASRKGGVGMSSYREVAGYAPIFCYAEREGYLVASEPEPYFPQSSGMLVDWIPSEQAKGEANGTIMDVKMSR